MNYLVRYGETIGDVVMNATGNIANWDLITEANGFDWVPPLYAGQIVFIPDNIVPDLNVSRQLNIYPANNKTVYDIYSQIDAVFLLMNPGDWILRNGYWDDSGYWRDTAKWIDG